MTFSKQQRHEIYKKALEFFESYDFVGKGNIGLCFTTDMVERELGIGTPYYINNYPEIIQHKPTEIISNDKYWFHTSARQKRIDILNQAIKETSE